MAKGVEVDVDTVGILNRKEGGGVMVASLRNVCNTMQ